MAEEVRLRLLEATGFPPVRQLLLEVIRHDTISPLLRPAVKDGLEEGGPALEPLTIH